MEMLQQLVVIPKMVGKTVLLFIGKVKEKLVSSVDLQR